MIMVRWRGDGARRRGIRWRSLPLLLIAVAAAVYIGYLLGRRDRQTGLVGLDSYQSLVQDQGYFLLHVHGRSMEPYLALDNYVLVQRTNRGIRRGDVLVTQDVGDHRVVGLPGETLRVERGRVRVCGPRSAPCRALAEPYVRYRDTTATFGPVVANGGWVLMADNRYLFPTLVSVVHAYDVVGIIRGSALSYGPLQPYRPQGWPSLPARPSGPTLAYHS